MKQEVRGVPHTAKINNFIAREGISLGQSALHEVYSKEEARKADLVDYALLDENHEERNTIYGKPNKKRELEPSMYDLLTGGYVSFQDEAAGTHKYKKQNEFKEEMTEEEFKYLQEQKIK